MQLAISCGVDGTQRDPPDEGEVAVEIGEGPSLRQMRRQSFATTPVGSSRAALVTRMHMTATMAATEEESAPPVFLEENESITKQN